MKALGYYLTVMFGSMLLFAALGEVGAENGAVLGFAFGALFCACGSFSDTRE